MNTFVCAVCGYIHFGEDAPERCPICFSPRDKFTENPEAIKKPADPKNLTDGDKKHIPDITISKQGDLAMVKVEVGEITHVMTPEHFITHIDVYLDNLVVSRTIFKPEMPQASVMVPVKIAGASRITVVESCNVHGNWMETGAL